MEQAVYDLMTVTPHEPPDAHFTAAEFARYREGYDYALVVALRTLKAAEHRFQMVERTKRLGARRNRKG